MKKHLLFTTIGALIISLIMVISFSGTSQSLVEVVVKFLVIPLSVFALGIPSIIEARKNKQYTPLLIHYLSLYFLLFAAFLATGLNTYRAETAIVNKTFYALTLSICVFSSIVAMSIGFYLTNLKKTFKSKDIKWVKIVTYSLYGTSMIGLFYINYRLVNKTQVEHNPIVYTALILMILAVAIFGVCHIVKILTPYKKAKSEKVKVLDSIDTLTLDDVYSSETEIKAEELFAASKKAETAPNQLSRANAKKKKRIIIKPHFNAVIRYIQTLEDVTIKANKKETSFRFYVKKKLFLIATNGQKNYKISFLYDLDQIAELMIEYPGAVIKAKTPKGDNWFKLINKGQFDEMGITRIILEAYGLPELLKERRALANKERRRIAAAKRREAQKLGK